MRFYEITCKKCNKTCKKRKGASFCSQKCRAKFNNDQRNINLTSDQKKIINDRSNQSLKRSRVERPDRHIFFRLRVKCKRENIPFDLNMEDIIIPNLCPLLNIPLNIHENGSSFDTPSVDRIDPSKGYVKGNVWIISSLANRMKQNANKDQLITFAKNILQIF